jgi:hypothetical protein
VVMDEVSSPNPVPVMMPTRGGERILEAMNSEASRILRSILEPPEKIIFITKLPEEQKLISRLCLTSFWSPGK